MDNQLMLFSEMEVQQKTWHIGLSEDLYATLRLRASRIKGIFVQATLAIGEELASAQKDLAYRDGGFVKWCEEEVGIDHQRAYEYIQIWDGYKMLPLSGNISSIGKKVLLLSSKEDVPQTAREEIVDRTVAGEKISLDEANEIIESHKRRAEEAEQKAKDTQQKLDYSYTKRDELSQQIAELEEKLRTAETPPTKEVIPQATLDQIDKLKKLNKKQKERNDMLSEEIGKLRDELLKQRDANEERRKQEQYVFGIKNGWKKATDVLHKALSQFMVEIPSPIALQAFEGDEWARYDQIEQALQYFQCEFAKLKNARYGDQFIDASVEALAVYEE